MVGHSVGHYQFQWKVNCRRASMGDEWMEMLSRGIMAGKTGGEWNGKVSCKFSGSDISLLETLLKDIEYNHRYYRLRAQD